MATCVACGGNLKPTQQKHWVDNESGERYHMRCIAGNCGICKEIVKARNPQKELLAYFKDNPTGEIFHINCLEQNPAIYKKFQRTVKIMPKKLRDTYRSSKNYVGREMREDWRNFNRGIREPIQMDIANIRRATMPQRGNPEKLAYLTPEEDKTWDKTWEFYVNEGYDDDTAGKLTWQDLQVQFPRLQEYDGAHPDVPKYPRDNIAPMAAAAAYEGGKYAYKHRGEIKRGAEKAARRGNPEEQYFPVYVDVSIKELDRSLKRLGKFPDNTNRKILSKILEGTVEIDVTYNLDSPQDVLTILMPTDDIPHRGDKVPGPVPANHVRLTSDVPKSAIDDALRQLGRQVTDDNKYHIVDALKGSANMMVDADLEDMATLKYRWDPSLAYPYEHRGEIKRGAERAARRGNPKEVQYKTPTSNHMAFTNSLRGHGFDVGSDAYYADPHNFTTVIVRDIPAHKYDELQAIAKEYSATMKWMENPVVQAAMAGRRAVKEQYPEAKLGLIDYMPGGPEMIGENPDPWDEENPATKYSKERAKKIATTERKAGKRARVMKVASGLYGVFIDGKREMKVRIPKVPKKIRKKAKKKPKAKPAKKKYYCRSCKIYHSVSSEIGKAHRRGVTKKKITPMKEVEPVVQEIKKAIEAPKQEIDKSELARIIARELEKM